MRIGRLPIARLGVLFAVVALAGCQDTGILLEISSDPDGGPPQTHSLSVYVGYQNQTDDPDSYRDADPIRDVIVDRDLEAEPYTVLVNRGEVEDRDMVVVAISRDTGGQVDGFGMLPEIRFSPGDFLRYRVELGQSNRIVDEDGDCVTISTDSGEITIGLLGDLDCDGSADGEDCDPHNGNVYPGQTEDCSNGIDDDCEGTIDQPFDGDGDGHESCVDDCDDGNNAVYEGAPESCDGEDNNCNGACDEDFDQDGDSYLGPQCDSGVRTNCEPNQPPDCNDGVDGFDINPGVFDDCDGKDNNCNGLCDEGFDQDGDGFLHPDCHDEHPITTDCQPGPSDCPLGDVDPLLDNNAQINPGMVEICDGLDNDCNPQTQERPTEPCFVYDVNNECVAGFRACAQGMIRDCEVSNPVEIVPREFCDASQQCENNPNPLQCFENTAGVPVNIFRCRVSIENGDTACPRNATLLSSSSAAGDTCEWRLPGGTFQQQFEVGLGDPDVPGALELEVNSCLARFTVESGPQMSPGAAFLVYETLNGEDEASQIIVLDTEVVSVASCDGGNQEPLCIGLAAPVTP